MCVLPSGLIALRVDRRTNSLRSTSVHKYRIYLLEIVAHLQIPILLNDVITNQKLLRIHTEREKKQ